MSSSIDDESNLIQIQFRSEKEDPKGAALELGNKSNNFFFSLQSLVWLNQFFFFHSFMEQFQMLVGKIVWRWLAIQMKLVEILMDSFWHRSSS